MTATGWLLTTLDGEVPTFGVGSFNSRPVFPSEAWLSSGGAQSTWTDVWFTNFIFEAILGAVLVIAFWLIVSHNMKVVPGKRQWIGEYVYNIVRNSIGREVLGENYHKFVPYLLALFSFIVLTNFFGLFFVFMAAPFAKIGFAWGLALLTWLLYNGLGIKKHGFFGYLKRSTMPPDVPWPLYILIIPLEFFSNIITRPITLGLRLFANLFAGHLVVLVFVVGGSWLLLYSNTVLYHIAGGLTLIVSFGIFALEMIVAFLQAYIFTVLTAQYVSSALSDEH